MDYLDADEDTQKKMTEEAPSQLEKIITNGYKGLGLEYFFTAGHDEVRVSEIIFENFDLFCLGSIPENLKIFVLNLD